MYHLSIRDQRFAIAVIDHTFLPCFPDLLGLSPVARGNYEETSGLLSLSGRGINL